MKYLLILIAWLTVYFVPSLIPVREDILFFSHQAGWSLLLIFLVFMVQRSHLTVMLAGVEVHIILLNLFAAIGFVMIENGYMTDFTYFYTQYEKLLLCLNTAGLVILLYWFPWHGLIDRLTTIRHYLVNRWTSHSRDLQTD